MTADEAGQQIEKTAKRLLKYLGPGESMEIETAWGNGLAKIVVRKEFLPAAESK